MPRTRPNTDFVDDVLAIPPEELVFFVGAGISCPQPACLPTGERLRRELADFLFAAPAFQGLPRDLAGDLRTGIAGGRLPVPGTEEHLQIHGLPLEGLLDIYQAHMDEEPVRRFLVQNLASGMSNTVHAALASCLVAAPPAVSAVVTTNYDTLIEQCMPAAARDRILVYREEDFASRPAETPVLYKLHGSIHEPKTVVSSLSAERALPDWKRECLLRLVEGKTVVVFGYSGFDFDVCPLLLEARTARFYWNSYRCEDDISGDAARILSLPGTVPMHGDAVLFFLGFSRVRMPNGNALLSTEADCLWSNTFPRSERSIDMTTFPPSEADKWVCLAALDVGAGSAALAMLSSLTDADTSVKEHVWYWLAKARAHFLESHSVQSLRLAERAYTAALKTSGDAIERIELRASRLGIAETRMSLLRRAALPHTGGAARRGVAWWIAIVQVGARWLGIWVDLFAASAVCRAWNRGNGDGAGRMRWRRAAGNLHLLAAQAVEGLYDMLKHRAKSTQLWRMARMWAAFHLWRVEAAFRKSDNYFGTQHAERLRIRFENAEAGEKARRSETQLDYYRRLGYVTAWSNSLRDVIRWRTAAGPASRESLNELLDRALQARALSQLIRDEPGTTKADRLIKDLMERGASRS
jgi:hypothetical protein